MNPKEQLDQEQGNKQDKKAALINAVLIGFLAGIVIFSIAKNGFGFFVLIPLYFIYKLVNKPKENQA